MIPVSLLLILVAVALLALGLTSGSSGLLIASIAASLLAAVALVIGARRHAGARRAATATQPAARPAAPASATAEAEPEPDFATEFAAARSAPTDFSGGPIAPDFSATDFSGPAAPDSAVYTEEPAFAEQAGYTEQPAYPEQPADTEPADTGQPVAPAAARTEEFGFGPDDEPPWRTRVTPESEVAAAAAPDYDRAASAIHAARSEQPEENQWRRDSHAEAAARSDLNRADLNRADLNAADLSAPAGLHDEFDEPDADDPDDEPLPQSVQPADAVRVARLDAEVLVVDGRPRYHLADCPHLVGRLTEPIPVNEAVELGFSPCGLCRPVDRLVAAAARH